MSDYGEAVASLQVVFCTEGAVTEFSLAGSHWTPSRRSSGPAACQRREVEIADSAALWIPVEKTRKRRSSDEQNDRKFLEGVCVLTLGWALMEASSSVYWLVFTWYSPLLDGKLREAMTDIIFWKPVAVKDTVMEGAEARARPMGHPRTATGSGMMESCTEPRSLTTGFSAGASSSTRSFASSSSASAKDFKSDCKKM